MRAQRRDRNEGAIRARAEALGFLWLENNASTKGRPDACLLRNGQTYWCEVKAPGESFTPAQMEEFPRLVAKGVPVYVLTSSWDVDRLNTGTLQPWAPSDVDVVRSAKGREKGRRAHRPGYSKARLGMNEVCNQPYCIRSKLPGKTTCATCAEREI